MELRQLEHFVAVSEEESFTHAAARMNIAQSGLSMSIRSLERELGVKLFARTPKRVKLTSAGAALLPEARRTLAAVREARASVEQTKKLLRGRLVVGTATYSTRDSVVRVLRRFNGLHPKVVLQIIQGPGQEKYDGLMAGKIDFIIGGRPPAPNPAITTIALDSCPFVLACARTHRLAQRSHLRLRQVAREPFIDLDRDWFSRRLVDQAFARAGVHRRSSCVVNDMGMLLHLVKAGLGVSVVPAVVAELPADIAYVPFKPELPRWHLVAAFLGPQPENPAARAFLGMVVTEFQVLSAVAPATTPE
jgi:DNA-binding transcriptional LysR family regulator